MYTFQPRHIVLALTLLFFSCETTPEVNNDDPRDLSLELTIADDGSGEVSVQATAINAVSFGFYLDLAEQAVEENTTGLFTHVFDRTGLYALEVRAYGKSGRYVKANRQLAVEVGKEVSVDDGYVSPLTYEGYKLVWNDEFSGSDLSSQSWKFEIGTGCPNCGWGNNELQYYRRENTTVGDGVLTIEARKESYQGSSYTSSRIISEGLRTFRYGRVDFRALLPEGQGIWPALWMLGSSFRQSGWPECGEIDIMEMVGGANRENTVHGTLHWGQEGNHASAGGSYTLPEGTFADEYHVFSIVWDEKAIAWYVNNQRYHTIDITPTELSEFHQDFFFIMNLAVGGNWPGNPDTTTGFPQRMKVDYVRVFQKQN